MFYMYVLYVLYLWLIYCISRLFCPYKIVGNLAKTSQYTGLPGETEWKRGSNRLKRLYKTKTSLAKAKTLLPSENVALKGEKTLLPSESVIRKGENAFTERKHLLKSEDVSIEQKHDNRAKTEPSQKR